MTGKSKIVPAASEPWGKVVGSTPKFASPTVAPLIEVISMLALQLTVAFALEPSATGPKLTGDVQFRGRFTGLPRQYRAPFASVTYKRVSPKAGRWNLLRPFTLKIVIREDHLSLSLISWKGKMTSWNTN